MAAMLDQITLRKLTLAKQLFQRSLMEAARTTSSQKEALCTTG
jgi:hypothetical protein